MPHAHHLIDPSQQPSRPGLLLCADEEPETQKREGTCQITWQLRQHLKTRYSESRSSPLLSLLILRAAWEGNESPVIREKGAEAAGPPAALIKQPMGSINPTGPKYQISPTSRITTTKARLLYFYHTHDNGSLLSPTPIHTGPALPPNTGPRSSHPPSHTQLTRLCAPSA